MRLSKSRAGLTAVVLTLAIALAFTATRLRADGNPPAQGAGNAASGSLTVEQLGDALMSYGKNSTTNNGHTDYSITVAKGKWNMNLIISLSPNGTVIWITNGLSAMPDANKLSTAALLDVLKKNTDIGPMFFSISGNSLQLNYPLPNYDMTADKLKQRIDDMTNTIANTATIWSADTLAGTGASGDQGAKSSPSH